MAKKKITLTDEKSKIKAEIEVLKEKTKILAGDSGKPKKTAKKTEEKPTTKKTAKKTEEKPTTKKTAKKTEEKPTTKKTAEKTEEKPTTKKTAEKTEVKPVKPKKLTKKELQEIKREEEKTLEEELEEQLTDNEIENFQIEKVDMERLTARVCDFLAEKESEGMFQSELWKRLKLTSRDGSRLALKLERMGTIYREKLLEKGRWTYKLILKKTPISTLSIENAPCLVCPVEQKCSLEGEISPKTCQLIEDWVIAENKKPTKTK
ncbi:MAG TPA: transcriptional regulator [Nitrosopumilaceae archaeon]|nr:transcriptional regulator [Nitrosopumilaceae archaeon]